MRHYHGTPLGGTRESVARFVSRGNRCFLVPFNRDEDMPIVALNAAGFCVDNGAFSAWQKNHPITNWQPYFDFVAHWMCHPSFDFALIPDVIDGDEGDNDSLLRDWQRRFANCRVEGVPVWHMHEGLDRLDLLCSGPWRRVAIGSSGQWSTPGTEGWWLRISEAMQVACDEHGRPRCKLHGLRMLDRDIVERLPLSSADSTNVAQNSQLLNRFGMYKPPTQCQRREVIAARIESTNSPPCWFGDVQARMFCD